MPCHFTWDKVKGAKPHKLEAGNGNVVIMLKNKLNDYFIIKIVAIKFLQLDSLANLYFFMLSQKTWLVAMQQAFVNLNGFPDKNKKLVYQLHCLLGTYNTINININKLWWMDIDYTISLSWIFTLTSWQKLKINKFSVNIGWKLQWF